MNRTMDEILNADFRTAPTPQEVEQWRQERIDLEAQLAESQRREELLRAVAVAQEWNYPDGNSGTCCFFCDRDERWGHSDDCKYKAAIDGGALKEQELATNGT